MDRWTENGQNMDRKWTEMDTKWTQNGQIMDIFWDSVHFLSIICPSVHFPHGQKMDRKWTEFHSSWTENGQMSIPHGQKMDRSDGQKMNRLWTGHGQKMDSLWTEYGQVGWTENGLIMDRKWTGNGQVTWTENGQLWTGQMDRKWTDDGQKTDILYEHVDHDLVDMAAHDWSKATHIRSLVVDDDKWLACGDTWKHVTARSANLSTTDQCRADSCFRHETEHTRALKNDTTKHKRETKQQTK